MLQKLLVSKGLDSDTSPEEFQVGFGRARLNVRVMTSDDGEGQSVEPVKGNLLVAFTLPAGVNKVIGAKEYLLKRKVYYFVYNSLNSHLILEFDVVTNSISKVFQDSANILGNRVNILNFSPDYLITGINVIKLDADNDLLYWTDWLNEPKKINIRKGKSFMLGDYVNGYKFPFDPQILYRIKQPPLYPPTYSWINTGSSGSPQNLIYATKGANAISTNISGVIVYAPNVLNNTSNEYNSSTGVTTISVAGTRGISATIPVADDTYYTNPGIAPEGWGRITVYKSGVQIYTEYKALSYSRNTYGILNGKHDYFNGATTFDLNHPDISFNVGDTFYIKVSGNATTTTNIYTNIYIQREGKFIIFMLKFCNLYIFESML
jgi:hypothetical protein